VVLLDFVEEALEDIGGSGGWNIKEDLEEAEPPDLADVD
jgi:hypothetical protein